MAKGRYHKDRLGGRKLKPDTLMLSYGYDPALSEGAVKPPVFLTSTFVFRSAEHGKEFFDYVSGVTPDRHGWLTPVEIPGVKREPAAAAIRK